MVYSGGRESRPYYDTAQVCRNGHVVNDRAAGSPQHNQSFCDLCGQATMTACDLCSTSIRGHYHSSIVILGVGPTPAPTFCYSCGAAFPWTEAKLKAANELTEEMDGLSDEEKARLRANLADLIAETPRTEIAAMQTKRLLDKARGEATSAFVDVLRQLVREGIKGTLFGG